jgi:putative DNA primase/helicase
VEWQDLLLLNKTGDLKGDIGNVQLILENDPKWKGVVGYCDFSYRIMKRKPPPFGKQSDVGEWTDADTSRLRIWFSHNYGITPKNADAHEAILVVAQEQRFHPVADYLTGLEWDGLRRVGTWLTEYLGVDQGAYSMAVAKKWLIAAVARVMRYPVKADCVLILEGNQGLGKSSALEVLGGGWFSDTHFALGEKDGYQQMQGVWICELAELDSFNKAESTRAKQFFGGKEDRYRPSYGRIAQNFPRQCVFAGTTNQENYFKDATGNRRYWPVMCKFIDVEALARDRDQLWAEALQLYRDGEEWWPSDDEKPLFEVEQDERFDNDAWEDLIVAWLIDPEQGATQQFTIDSILSGALRMEPAQMKPPEQKRVGQIMTRLGWRKSRPYIEDRGKRVRKNVYSRPVGWLANERECA